MVLLITERQFLQLPLCAALADQGIYTAEDTELRHTTQHS